MLCYVYIFIILYLASGASNDPCHEVYHGPFAFSEPESQAVRNFLKKIPARAFISLHSYSQLWLIPYSHKKHTYPSDIASVLVGESLCL